MRIYYIHDYKAVVFNTTDELLVFFIDGQDVMVLSCSQSKKLNYSLNSAVWFKAKCRSFQTFAKHICTTEVRREEVRK